MLWYKKKDSATYGLVFLVFTSKLILHLCDFQNPMLALQIDTPLWQLDGWEQCWQCLGQCWSVEQTSEEDCKAFRRDRGDVQCGGFHRWHSRSPIWTAAHWLGLDLYPKWPFFFTQSVQVHPHVLPFCVQFQVWHHDPKNCYLESDCLTPKSKCSWLELTSGMTILF